MRFSQFGWIVLIGAMVGASAVWLANYRQPAVLSDHTAVQRSESQLQSQATPASSPAEKILDRSVEHIRETITNLVKETREVVNQIEPVESILLTAADEEIEVFDHAYVWSLPTQKISTHPLLKLSLNITTEEQAPGFDYPAVRLLVDDQVIYQVLLTELDCFPAIAASCQSGWKTIQLSLEQFATPRQLTITSGNTGDELFPTTVQVKNIQLLPAQTSEYVLLSSVKSIDDLTVISDVGGMLTLAWTAPDNASLWLDRALSYDIRYSSELITPRLTDQEWLGLPAAVVMLPEVFSPLAPGFTQRALISLPTEMVEPAYLAIRASDERGRLSPLTNSSMVLVPRAD